MIIKKADNKDAQIADLQDLLGNAPAEKKTLLEKELRILRAGIKTEKEAAYFIDFDYRDSKNQAVIHDLRLEIGGRVAQIDHLIINRMMMCHVIETKSFNHGFKIDEDGQFLRWNNYQKSYAGMPSPLTQNERHIAVLKDAAKQIEWPTRLGLKLSPTFHSCVLVSSQSRIDRPKKLDTQNIVKADEFKKYLDSVADSLGVIGAFGKGAKLVSSDTLQNVAHSVAALHRPIKVDYASRFKIDPQPAMVAESSHEKIYGGSRKCSKCGGPSLAIVYGRYGYYFKCADCAGNTAIKLTCQKCGMKERIRKKKDNFYRECRNCKSSELYFQNSE